MGYVDLSTLHTPIGGARPPAAYGRQIEANFDHLAGPPRCRIHNSAALSIPHNADTLLTFNSEDFDTDTMHSAVTNPGRITFTTAGTYLIGVHLVFATNATGIRNFTLSHSTGGPLVSETKTAQGSFATTLSTTTLFAAAAGTFVSLTAYQNSGGALDINSSSAFTPYFWAIWQSL